MKKIVLSFIICMLMSLNPTFILAQENIASYNLIQSGGVITTSEGANASLPYLNDKNDTTLYVVENYTNETWIQFESVNPVVVTGYSMISGYDEAYDPKKWSFEYSDNGTNWTVIHEKIFLSPDTFQSRCSAMNIRTGLSGASALHKFYRLKIKTTSSGVTGKFSIAELQLFGNPDTYENNITSNGGILTGQFPGLESYGEVLANLIDGRTNKFCQTGTTSFWAQYESSQPVKLAKYSLATAWTAKRFPRSWQILGSNDGIHWDILDVQKNRNFFDAPYSRLFFEIDKQSASINWAQYADLTYQSLVDNYWTLSATEQNLNKTVINYFKQRNAPDAHTGYNYWWMAHAIDVVVDGYNRTKDNKTYRQKMSQLYSGVEFFGNGHAAQPFWNSYYDDMEWMGLALLRAYEAFGDERYKTQAHHLFEWIVNGWTEVNNGGISWNSGSGVNSKNACSNGPAMILAARLYTFFKDFDPAKADACLTWAKKIYNWMDLYMVDHEKGYVWDGYGNHNIGNVYTYNIGTWMGGCLELYLITGEAKYLQQATLSADCVVNDMKKFSPYGILYNGENGGDGGLFKGIFMRYLSQMILKGNLDEKNKNNYINYFRDNGISLWNSATLRPNMIVSKKWYEKPDGISQDCSIQLSGVMLFECLDELKRNGCMPDKNEEIHANAEKYYKFFRLNMQVNYGDSASELGEWQLFGGTVGLDKISLSSPIQVYAGAGGIRILNPESRSASYRISDISGKQVAAGHCHSNAQWIPITHKGIYMIQIAVDGQVYGQKVLIQ